jgi:hypothetical protein
LGTEGFQNTLSARDASLLTIHFISSAAANIQEAVLIDSVTSPGYASFASSDAPDAMQTVVDVSAGTSPSVAVLTSNASKLDSNIY